MGAGVTGSEICIEKELEGSRFRVAQLKETAFKLEQPLKQGAVSSSENGTLQLVNMTQKENSLVLKVDKDEVRQGWLAIMYDLKIKIIIVIRVSGKYVELYFAVDTKKEGLHLVYQLVEYFFEELAIEVEKREKRLPGSRFFAWMDILKVSVDK